MFTLSKRSLTRLKGVHPDLVSIVHRAIKETEIDFGVSEGLRTKARQRKLVASGASTTMRSRHLTGHAVDLVAYVGPRIAWDWNLYFLIAESVRLSAIELRINVEWGAAWGRMLNDFPSARAASNNYVDERRSQGREPFMDGPHMQLSWKDYPSD